MIDNKTKEMVWALHEIDRMPKAHIALQLDISRQKVYDILADDSYKNRHLNDGIKKLHREQTESLLNSLRKDYRPGQIVDKILTILNDEKALEKELKKNNGFRNIVGAMKVMIDTGATANRDMRERDKAEQENILNTTEVMNDNFENAMMKAIKDIESINFDELIEEDSLDVPVVQ